MKRTLFIAAMALAIAGPAAIQAQDTVRIGNPHYMFRPLTRGFVHRYDHSGAREIWGDFFGHFSDLFQMYVPEREAVVTGVAFCFSRIIPVDWDSLFAYLLLKDTNGGFRVVDSALWSDRAVQRVFYHAEYDSATGDSVTATCPLHHVFFQEAHTMADTFYVGYSIPELGCLSAEYIHVYGFMPADTNDKSYHYYYLLRCHDAFSPSDRRQFTHSCRFAWGGIFPILAGADGCPATHGLEARYVEGRCALLAWNNVPGTQGYQLEYGPEDADTHDWTLKNTAREEKMVCLENGGTWYAARVRAECTPRVGQPQEYGPWSDTVRFYVPADTTPDTVADTTAHQDTVAAGGLWQLENEGTTLFPNPADKTLAVQTRDGVELVDVTLFDAAGRRVLRESRRLFSVVDLPQGSYVARIRTSAGVSFSKVVIRR